MYREISTKGRLFDELQLVTVAGAAELLSLHKKTVEGYLGREVYSDNLEPVPVVKLAESHHTFFPAKELLLWYIHRRRLSTHSIKELLMRASDLGYKLPTKKECLDSLQGS